MRGGEYRRQGSSNRYLRRMIIRPNLAGKNKVITLSSWRATDGGEP
jgi:hypothetical protein